MIGPPSPSHIFNYIRTLGAPHNPSIRNDGRMGTHNTFVMIGPPSHISNYMKALGFPRNPSIANDGKYAFCNGWWPNPLCNRPAKCG